MPLQFPTSPALNQFYQHNDVLYQWNGTVWRRADIYKTPIVSEYTDIVEQTSATVDIQPNKYNYYKINVDVPVTIDIPNASPYTSLIMELNNSIPTTYDLTNGSYDNVSFSDFSGLPAYWGGGFVISSLAFKPDGTKFYVTGNGSLSPNFSGDPQDWIHQYSMTTFWDITTASLESSYDTSVTNSPGSRYMSFKPDGTKLYASYGGGNYIGQHTLSTPWDISTASYDSKFIDFNTIDSDAANMFIKTDGTKMYLLKNNGLVLQYSFGTPWDISTVTDDLVSLDLSANISSSFDFVFKSDGTELYIGNENFSTAGNEKIIKYILSTAWDLSTATYSEELDLSNEAVNYGVLPSAIYIKPDGVKLYVGALNPNTILQYDITTTAIQATWSNNILWSGGSAPTFDNTYDKTVLLHFITYDGAIWVANQLSLDSRSS